MKASHFIYASENTEDVATGAEQTCGFSLSSLFLLDVRTGFGLEIRDVLL